MTSPIWAVGRILQEEIKQFTKSLNVSLKRLKKHCFTKNNLNTCKIHTLSMQKDAGNEVTLFYM